MFLLSMRLYFWPIFTAVWLFLTVLIAYILSAALGHLYPLLPFISDTALHPPESCIFGQMLNFGALFVFIVSYIRYSEVDHAIEYGHIKLSKSWNDFNAICGLISAVGISLVANFQENRFLVLHYIGAALAFGVGGLYFLVQTKITYRFTRQSRTSVYNSLKTIKRLYWTRFILSFGVVAFILLATIFNVISYIHFGGANAVWITEEHSGYGYRLTATISEWIMCFLQTIYIATFTVDFRYIKFEGVKYLHTRVK